MTAPIPGTTEPSAVRTTLALSDGSIEQRTLVRECDAHTALVRGLAEYLTASEIAPTGGRHVRFKKVREEWAEPEEQAQYPSAAIYTVGDGLFDASSFTPVVNRRSKVPGTEDAYLVKLGEFTQDLVLEIWCTDKKERAAIAFAMEDKLNPVDFMAGFVLTLPHYFSARATYLKKTVTHIDNEGDAVHRLRKLVYVVNASVDLLRPANIPGAKPRFDLAAVGPDVDVLLNVP